MLRNRSLRKNYRLYFLTGIILAQLLIIGALKIELEDSTHQISIISAPDEIQLTLPPATKTVKKPPPAFTPVPVSIPNDSPIDAPPIDFGTFDDAFLKIPLPPEPNDDDTDEIPFYVEVMPKMKGGIQALYDEINYPEMATRNGIEGLVVVEFTVTEKGGVINAKIIREIGGGCDEEVLRAIKLQSFNPGIQNGKFVKVRIRQPVRFRLQ